MSIKEVMKIGTNGLTAKQKDEEQARRLKVVERINHLGKLAILMDDQKKKNRINRELKRIKADESEWLKQVAWFLYA